MKYYMQRVRLDQGGYYNFGRGSRYYGKGLPMYRVSTEDGASWMLRGITREAAKQYFREWYDVNARFYR